MEQEKPRKRPSDPIEGFVHEMVESGKKPFDKPKPNIAEENEKEIERITDRIRDRIQRS